MKCLTHTCLLAAALLALSCAGSPDISRASDTIFVEPFSGRYKVPEAPRPDRSINTRLWLSSGAYLYVSGGVGSTIEGNLPFYDPWRIIYFFGNPIDTDNGYRPQNIFRLVTRDSWQNFRQQAYFRIIKDNLSESPNRNASNGLFFFHRYQNEHTVYYTGIRVDGHAVIKKKFRGVYTTLDYRPLGVSGIYDRENAPNLLPKDEWIGVASEIRTNTDGTVDIAVFVDRDGTDSWETVAHAIDNAADGRSPITAVGRAGIRTDFMDVEFREYTLETID